jgi:hypothetical protein
VKIMSGVFTADHADDRERRPTFKGLFRY